MLTAWQINSRYDLNIDNLFKTIIDLKKDKIFFTELLQ